MTQASVSFQLINFSILKFQGSIFQEHEDAWWTHSSWGGMLSSLFRFNANICSRLGFNSILQIHYPENFPIPTCYESGILGRTSKETKSQKEDRRITREVLES